MQMTEIGWSHLFSRFGNRGNSSSEENIRRAVQEMYHEDYASLSEGNYVEHPDAWINYGFDSGPVYMLTIRRFGELLLEKRLDQDDIDPAESFRAKKVDEETCCRICMSLVAGDLDFVRRAAAWKPSFVA
jgi:hypothetical protein